MNDKRPIYVFSMMYLHSNFDFSIDASEEDETKGRLINHSKGNPNLEPKIFPIRGRPRLMFRAIRDIQPDEELSYNYGDTNASSTRECPWLLL